MENTIERLLTDYEQLKVVCDDIEKAVLMIEESISAWRENAIMW